MTSVCGGDDDVVAVKFANDDDDDDDDGGDDDDDDGEPRGDNDSARRGSLIFDAEPSNSLV